MGFLHGYFKNQAKAQEKVGHWGTNLWSLKHFLYTYPTGFLSILLSILYLTGLSNRIFLRVYWCTENFISCISFIPLSKMGVAICWVTGIIKQFSPCSRLSSGVTKERSSGKEGRWDRKRSLTPCEGSKRAQGFWGWDLYPWTISLRVAEPLRNHLWHIPDMRGLLRPSLCMFILKKKKR